MRLVRFIFSFAFAALLVAVAHAQSVRWEPAESGTASVAVLVFDDCAPDGMPDLPTIPGVTFTFAGQSESMNIVNFQMSRTVALTYQIRSQRNAPVQIPAFTVKTSKGPKLVPAFNAAAPAAPIESVASAKLIPERTSVWAGEVFGLNYELSASRRTNPQISPTFDWNAAPLVAEDWSKPEVTEAIVNNERRLNVLFRTRAIAKSTNRIKLEAATHLLSIQTGSYGTFFGPQARVEQVSVTSDQPTIEVRPLPPSPPGFSGAVGQFKLTSKVVPEKAAVGEPVTWTLELSGTGNWPDIAGLPSREVSNDFQVVQPKAKRTPAEGKLFDVTLAEDVVLVPTKAGTYTLGPIAFTFFDPKSGTYVTRSAPRTSITITTPTTPQVTFGGKAPITAPNVETPAAKAPTPPSTPAPLAKIPGDTLPGTAAARVPMSARALAVWLLSPFVLLLLFWTWLAVRRARQTDPVRPRREARDRLAQTLSHLPSASEADRDALLLAWQKDAAILWQLAHAAPRATAFRDNAPWSTLWAEADRTLYGPRVPLPSDWVARAQEALAATRLPGFKPLRLFLPQNLMPFAAVLALALVSTAAVLHAAAATDGEAAYRKGDFAAAEKAWRGRLAEKPTDWIARHNLALALAQEERAGEATAQAAAAFVQNPSHPSVRWHFALAADKSGTLAPPLAAFLSPGLNHALARRASPADWQVALILCAFVIALALGGLLTSAYRPKSRSVTVTAITILVLGVCGSATAFAGWFTYGIAAQENAVVIARGTVLHSIPTEADTTQKTSALAAGSIAVTDKTFLGWTHLAFENGQTGWVRKEEVVPLWK